MAHSSRGGTPRGGGRAVDRAAGDPPVGTPVCGSCGRVMTPRRSWRDNEVRWCSDACRRRKVTATDRALEDALRSLLAARPAAATVCPSEAARLVAAAQPAPQPGRAQPRAQPREAAPGRRAYGPGGDPADDPDARWRALMEPARAAARRLVAAGEVQITQAGRVVDPSTARGPIRVRRAR